MNQERHDGSHPDGHGILTASRKLPLKGHFPGSLKSQVTSPYLPQMKALDLLVSAGSTRPFILPRQQVNLHLHLPVPHPHAPVKDERLLPLPIPPIQQKRLNRSVPLLVNLPVVQRQVHIHASNVRSALPGQ